uniref:Uncharacterized protein n=1 Tax=Glossina morsitans morsitans TaxID=37546 RepID=A0A1B0FLB5_GLOMM
MKEKVYCLERMEVKANGDDTQSSVTIEFFIHAADKNGGRIILPFLLQSQHLWRFVNVKFSIVKVFREQISISLQFKKINK